jgi:cold shock CspA family protein
MNNEMKPQFLQHERTTYVSTVTKWDAARAFGWIAHPDLVSSDLFCHKSSLVDRRALAPGEIVSFQLKPAAKGPVCVNVRVLESKAVKITQSETEKATDVNDTIPFRR